MCCGLFAFVTPYLVAPGRIQTSMFGFAGIVLVATISGIIMMRLQKKYPVLPTTIKEEQHEQQEKLTV